MECRSWTHDHLVSIRQPYQLSYIHLVLLAWRFILWNQSHKIGRIQARSSPRCRPHLIDYNRLIVDVKKVPIYLYIPLSQHPSTKLENDTPSFSFYFFNSLLLLLISSHMSLGVTIQWHKIHSWWGLNLQPHINNMSCSTILIWALYKMYLI